jgi:predicted N-acyltransferase/multidrug transporter EmrE-like cation transporter
MFQTSHGVVRVVQRAHVEGVGVWPVSFSDHRQDHRYYRIVEDTILQGFTYRYLVVEDEEGKVHGVQPCFLLDQDVLEGAGKVLQRLAGWVRKVFPRFLFMRTLMVGCAAGEGHLDGVACEKTELLARNLHGTLRDYAREAKASLIVMKEFPSAYREAMSCMASDGYARIPSFPMTRLTIDFPNFETYLNTRLSKNARKNLRKNLREAEAGGKIELQVLNDVTPIVDEVYPLYLQVFDRAKLKFEKLTKEYLCRLGQEMPDKARFFVWRKDGRAVAFAVTMVNGDALYDLYLGMEYPLALELHLYYYTFRDVLNWMIGQGLKRYCSTPLGYDPKLRLGCDLVPLDLYVRHRSPFINFFMKRILPYLEPTRTDPTLKEFSNYHELWGRPKAVETTAETKDVPAGGLKGFWNPYVQILIGALLVTASELMLKKGATMAGGTSWMGIDALKSVWTWGGIVTYVLSFASWLYVLRYLPLGIAFTLINVVHVLVPLASWGLRHAAVTGRRWAGIVLVLVGIVVMAGNVAKVEEKL